MGERKEESARRTGGKGGGLKVREREGQYRRGGEGKRGRGRMSEGSKVRMWKGVYMYVRT